MTDLEMTRLCAEAMGIDLTLNPAHALCPVGATRAEREKATGYWWGDSPPGHPGKIYDPLHDDAQAMALVKKFGLTCHNMTGRNMERPEKDRSPLWSVYFESMIVSMTLDGTVIPQPEGNDDDLNRAIVECVSFMGLLAGAP